MKLLPIVFTYSCWYVLVENKPSREHPDFLKHKILHTYFRDSLRDDKDQEVHRMKAQVGIPTSIPDVRPGRLSHYLRKWYLH